MNTALPTPNIHNQDVPFFVESVTRRDNEKGLDDKNVDMAKLPIINQSPLFDMEKSSYDGMYVTEEEYWSKYYEMSDVSLEWNNGILEEKPMPDRESFELYSWLWRLLTEYFDNFNEGMLIGLETGFKLTFDNHTSIRKPDLAFIHKDNPNQMAPFERTYHGCFDICFEFISDSDKSAIERDTVVKKHEYEKFGVKEYYILDRIGDETAYYYLNSKGLYQALKPDKDGVIHSTILEKFRFREEDLYNRPKMISLVNDNVYRDFVMMAYQKERKARKESEKLEKLAKVKAENARMEAENARVEANNARMEAENARVEANNARMEAENARMEAKNAIEKAQSAESYAEKEKYRANQAEMKIQHLEQELARLRS